MTMLLACLLSFAQAATVQIGGGGSTVTGGSCAADTYATSITNFAVSLVAIGSVNSTANVLGTYGNGVIVFKAKASTAVQYQTFSYASSGSPAMTYTTRFVLEQLD